MPRSEETPAQRLRVVVFGVGFIFVVLIARLIDLTWIQQDFLRRQGNARAVRVVDVPAYRGMIVDRRGEPLAVSTAVYSVWINPQDFSQNPQAIDPVCRILKMSIPALRTLLRKEAHRQFVYVKRGVTPEVSQKISALNIPGIYLEKTYRRYYPTGEVSAHVIGFTDIDDHGLEGMELAYDGWLRGEPGKQEILQDLYGHEIALLRVVRREKPGQDLWLSIDNRIQFLAHRVLQGTIDTVRARSGSAIVLNVRTGEILAIVNAPTYNPNHRPIRAIDAIRNRAVTDMFEPGSTIKVFTAWAALASGRYQPNTVVNTAPGWMRVKHNFIRDMEGVKNGPLTVTQILQKSSNVGIAKMLLSLPPEDFLDLLKRVGFGEKTGSGFPGERTGTISEDAATKPFVLATMSFGYGISVTALQLAQAYGIIAREGVKCPLSFLKREDEAGCEQVLDRGVTRSVLRMLESVVGSEGTGALAKVARYRIAGKTGTAKIAGAHGYESGRYIASFVGIAPASRPEVVVAVVIQDPQGERYSGGQIAAPAFARIMAGVLDILNVSPDRR